MHHIRCTRKNLQHFGKNPATTNCNQFVFGRDFSDKEVNRLGTRIVAYPSYRLRFACKNANTGDEVVVRRPLELKRILRSNSELDAMEEKLQVRPSDLDSEGRLRDTSKAPDSLFVGDYRNVCRDRADDLKSVYRIDFVTLSLEKI